MIFAFRDMDNWNSLPSDVDAPSLQALKSRLDEIWKNKKFLHQFAYPRSDLSVWNYARITLAGKDQIKAFSLSKSDTHIISYQKLLSQKIAVLGSSQGQGAAEPSVFRRQSLWF